ncbi:hypothetical protein K469DRAFT_713791 [Zopfia rhizophila CBS 207.26]|uniref:Actin-like ATPase domain-containing protein n=1 Tax=Zopfia rhizophila CBS 207.26 TaxID=1314779 RepID=A0A6A6DP79_9PEZI|nr:hypothetical protein K469DRAFT_713791 [Zopfia rhizophila CBS 207.26]
MPSGNLSRESTVTVTCDGLVAPRSPSDDVDSILGHIVPDEGIELLLGEPTNRCQSKRLIIAVDFGTTYSAVSFMSLAEGENAELVGSDRILSIKNFPGDSARDMNDRMRDEVPTEVIYPLNRRFRSEGEWDSLQTSQVDGPANGDEDEGPELSQTQTMDVDMTDYEEIFDEAEFRTIAQPFQWGYKVHEAWRFPDTHFDKTNQALSRFKLLLDTSQTTEAVRTQVAPTFEALAAKKIIKGPLTVIADYLTCLLRHTKSELRTRGFDDSYPVELVMCVPAIWSQKACRDMQTAMAKAMQQAQFQGVDIQNNSIENLFIVSEPEAAAAYVLATDHTIRPHDTFVLLDAGGGTVDANTYTVSQTTPLRLTSEVVEPGGGLYGSSYLNEAFQAMLLERLENETYLEHDKITLRGIVETIVLRDFEQDLKRNFDIYDTNKLAKRFVVYGLRDDRKKGFRNSCIYVKFDTIKDIFMKCLEGIESIMRNQIQTALDKGVVVDKVILIGGFAASISLQRYLRKYLDAISTYNNCHIRLVVPENQVTAVASGAVLRALNKEQGPRRLARSSYGILRTEPFMDYPEHSGLKPSYDRYDGLPCIKNTIDWVLKKGVEVHPVWRCEPFLSSHLFPCKRSTPLLCKEVLYVSDTSTESHYRESHAKNRGAEEVGAIEVDFSFLRDQGLIRPVEPDEDEQGRKVGQRHYKVEYNMIIQVVDRDLRCYAIYNNEVIKKCRINIASAFSPGAK